MAKRKPTSADPPDRGEDGPAALRVRPVWVGLAFAALALAVYAPALSGPFFSDDAHYVQNNVYIQNPSVENWIEIWSPTSIVVSLVENWAPVQLSLHALAWAVFGPDVLGHHVFNVLLHALASTLLFVFFARNGIPRRVALGLAAFFLVHPGNVEAVAWISQLKTTSSMCLALTALLLQPKRPVWALVAFAVALLAKPTAAVALPVGLVLGWAGHQPARSTVWLAGWALAFAGFAVAELSAFFDTAGRAESLYQGAAEQLRSHVAIVFRYAVMAATGWKLSLFHEPAAVRSGFDPWWLSGLALMIAIAGRSLVLLRRRSAELAFWVWTVASFVPVSGLASLPYPMADRYLYFLLPGLLGGCAGLAIEFVPRLGIPDAARLRPVLRAVAVVALAVFAVGANRHASLWSDSERLLSHAERAYPEGQVARLRAADRAAAAGDAATTVRLLEAAIDRGFDRLDALLGDPRYAALRGDPGFDAIIERLARQLIAGVEARSDPSQAELRVLAQAHWVIGDLAGAEAGYRSALEASGPYAVEIRRELDAVGLERRLGGGEGLEGGRKR